MHHHIHYITFLVIYRGFWLWCRADSLRKWDINQETSWGCVRPSSATRVSHWRFILFEFKDRLDLKQCSVWAYCTKILQAETCRFDMAKKVSGFIKNWKKLLGLKHFFWLKAQNLCQVLTKLAKWVTCLVGLRFEIILKVYSLRITYLYLMTKLF